MFPRGMESFRMSCFLVIFLLSFTLDSFSEAKNEKKLPSTVVVGTVYCDTCFESEISKNNHFISGASVAVECQDGNSSPSFRKEVRTDRHGKFRVHLPFSVSKHAKKIEGCSVKLIKSSERYCAVASTATSSSLHLKARKEGAQVFSAGFFTFKPQKQPDVCNQKPIVRNAKEFRSRKTLIPPPSLDPSFPPPLQDPTTPNNPIIPGMPNLPNLPPLPQLPPLPPLVTGVPLLPPVPGKTKEVKTTKSTKKAEFTDNKNVHPENFLPTPELPPLGTIPGFPTPLLPPNPLLPPSTPGILPPNPLQPPSTPGILPPFPLLPPPLLPPNPVLPPPAPLIPLPPVPGLTPPPAQPTFPIPLPPGFPGLPPASSSPKKSTP